MSALKKAGVVMLGYGSFITAVINFLILAFVIFMLVRAANKVMRSEPRRWRQPPTTSCC